ncbi:MAG: tripartite tricarboxylate transporter permease [Geminicoccaceae bacterium]
MVDAALTALVMLLQPYNLAMLLSGVIAGVFVGILPGLGGTVGMIILLPFVYGMDPYAALALFMGMTAILRTVDSIPAVLFALPGTAGSQATIMDGYPLARKGEAGRALGAAFTASMIGGVFGAAALSLSLPLAKPIISSLGSPEFLMLSILGITMVGVLSGARPLRGVIAGFLGVLASSIGGAPSAVDLRYTFGLPYLMEGIPLVVLAMGLFAVPEIVDLIIRGTAISDKPQLGRGAMVGVRDTLRNFWLVLRCSVIGTFVGFLPGMGASAANWMAYGHAVQTARDKSQFGKGDIRGVIAPEAANDSSAGGSLIPTILFGIPGSAAMAVFLYALIVLGINPGPTMLTQQLDMAYTMVWGLALGNIIASIVCILISVPLSRLTTISVHYWVPFALIIILLASYQSTRSWGDLAVLVLMSLIGWFMKRLSWPRPPLLIGFVLGAIMERYLWLSSMRYGMEWMTRPLVIVIALITVASVIAGLRASRLADTTPAAARASTDGRDD